MDNYMYITGYTIAEKLVPSRIGILPVGCLEYHGPHLPIGTDSILALEVARRVAEELDAVLLPLMTYTPAWTDVVGYPATININRRVYVEYLVEVLRGVLSSGLGAVLMLNCHGLFFEREAGQRVADEFPDKKVMQIAWWDVLPRSVITDELKLFDHDPHGHGNSGEGSMAAAIAPDSVDISKARNGQTPVDPNRTGEIAWPWTPLTYLRPTGRRPDWPGYLGEVSQISAEKGEVMIRESSRRIAEVVRRLFPGAAGS